MPIPWSSTVTNAKQDALLELTSMELDALLAVLLVLPAKEQPPNALNALLECTPTKANAPLLAQLPS